MSHKIDPAYTKWGTYQRSVPAPLDSPEVPDKPAKKSQDRGEILLVVKPA